MSTEYSSTYRGIVVNNADPQNEARVTLKVADVLGSATSNWAVPAIATTTIPAPGDLVWVTFEGGDPNRPIYTPPVIAGTGGGDGGSDVYVGSPPKPPSGLLATVAREVSPEGATRSSLTLTWDPATENQDGSVPIKKLAGYRVQWSYDQNNWQGGWFGSETSVRFSGLDTNRPVYVRAQSISETSGPGTWVTTSTTTAAASAPDVPSDPNTTGWVHAIVVDWNGLSQSGVALPNTVSHVVVERSESSNFTAVTTVGTMAGKGSLVDSAVTLGTLYYYRLRAVTRAGVASASSGYDTAAPQQDGAIVDVQNSLAGLSGKVDGKATIYVQSTDPNTPSGTLSAADTGDVWINNGADPRVIKTWTGSAWVEADSRTAQTLSAVATKITTFYAADTAVPSATAVGDLWVVTNQNNRLKRASALGTGSWVYVDDTRIAAQATAIGTLQNDLTTANGRIDGKAVVYVQSTAPTGLVAADQGDLWVNSTTKKTQYWTGSAWADVTNQQAADAAAAAATAQTTANGKITTFYAASTATPTAVAVGDLWSVTDLGALKRWSGTAWVDTGLASDAATKARGTDLVTNGNGMLGSNVNFKTSFTFNGADAPTGTGGSFVINTATAQSAVADDLIPFDPAKKYKFSFMLRQTVSGATSKAYGFISPYDAAGQSIAPAHYMYVAGTTTTLAQPVQNGDTKIYLTSVANWYGQSGKAAGASTHLRALMVWAYTDPFGKTWPVGSYSRLVSGSDRWDDGAVNPTDNSITLKTPWNLGAFAAGTSLSNSTSGGSFLYNPSCTNVTVPETWTTYSDIWSAGILPSASQAVASSGAATWATGVPSATAKIRVGWLLNYAPTSGQHAVAAVSFSDVAAAQSTADSAATAAANAQTSANGKNKVTYSTTTPGSTANSSGDVWFQKDVSTGNIISMWVGGGGTSWVSSGLNHQVIASLDLGKATVGELTGDRIAANALIGKTYASALSGARWEINAGADSRTIYAYSGLPQETAPGGISSRRAIPLTPDTDGYIGAINIEAPGHEDYPAQAPRLSLISGGSIWNLNEPAGGGLYPTIEGTAHEMNFTARREIAHYVGDYTNAQPDGSGVLFTGGMSIFKQTPSESDTGVQRTLTDLYANGRLSLWGGDGGSLNASPRIIMDETHMLIDDGGNDLDISAEALAVTAQSLDITSEDIFVGRTSNTGLFVDINGPRLDTGWGTRVIADPDGVRLLAGGKTLALDVSTGNLAFDGALASLTNSILSVGSTSSSAQKYLSTNRLNNQGGGDGLAYEVRGPYLYGAAKSGMATTVRANNAEVARMELSENGMLVGGPSGTNPSPMRAKEFRWSVNTSLGVSSSTPTTMGTSGGSGTFVAPQSGAVKIAFGGQTKSSTDGSYVAIGIELRAGGTVGSGTTVRAYDVNESFLNYNIQYVVGMVEIVQEGLTPGATYNIRTVMASSTTTGGTGVNQNTAVRGRIVVTPLL